jgi:hypothetical protein
MAHPASLIRLRVSSVLLLIGVAFLPWAAGWIPRPDWSNGPYVGPVFSFLAYDFSAQLIGIGGLIALVSFFWFSAKRNWAGTSQAVFEFFLALGAILVLPAY